MSVILAFISNLAITNQPDFMKYFFAAFFILSIFFANAASKISFEHLTIEGGLANNSVRSIFQDRRGYLWFGTLNGLSRYDGQQFKTFKYIHGDSTSIGNNKIRDIIQDGNGYIWVMTYDNQAHRFDPKSEAFVNFPLPKGKLADLSVRSIYESSPGVIWLSLFNNGCLRIISHPNSSKFESNWFSVDSGLPSNEINFIQASKSGGVWIGTTKGLFFIADDHWKGDQLQQSNQSFINPSYSISCLYESGDDKWVGAESGQLFHMKGDRLDRVWENPSNRKETKNITFIESIQDGNLCVGTRNGLLIVHPGGNQIEYFTNQNSTLNSNDIERCYNDRFGDLWLVTDQRGITRFQPQKKSFTHYPLHPETRKSILEGEKQIFREDHNGDLWVGIYGGGIARFNRETNSFDQFLHEKNNPGSLSSNMILSVFEDRSGNLWAGTYKRGVDKVNLQQNNFHSLISSSGTNQDFNSEVRAVFEDSRHWIWTGNRRGEIVVYDLGFHKLFELNDFLGKDKITAGIYAFEEDEQHNIWVGTKGNGIFVLKHLPKRDNKFQSSKLKITHLWSDPSKPNSLSFNDVFDLHEDRYGQMWVALYHGGVNVIKNPLKPDQKVLYYLHNENDKFAISDNRVRCFLEDKHGNMWIGTADGLNFLRAQYVDTDNKKFIQIKRTGKSGSLSNNDIICLYQDSKNNIWVGTYGGGLNKVQQKNGPTFVFDHLDKNNGLSSDLVLSIVEGVHNNLWIGTDFGLCKYDLQDQVIEDYYLADGLGENSFSEGPGILISNKRVLFGLISGMFWFDPTKIKKSERSVPVVLTGLQINGKANLKQLHRAREILGDSLQALELNYDQNFLTFEFAALDYKAPSKIQYQFKLENYEQNWNKSGNLNKAIYRELKPGTYLFRMEASNSDGLWTNPEMKLSLTIDPPPWETTWAYFIYLVLFVGFFLLVRRIVLDRIQLKHEVQFEKQLADDKLKFYTSISHEFKTPLALILGPVEDLLARKDLTQSAKAPLKMVRRNTKRLLELIDQLMDFRKVQKGAFKLEYSQADVIQFLHEIYEAFVPLAKRKNIQLSFEHDLKELRAMLDFKLLEKIIFNLLSNAFKHTGSEKHIRLKFWIEEETQQLVIAVEDEGEGIREQDLPKLFERFNLGNSSNWRDESSTGVGLSLTKELVELQGGCIDVESKVGEGSCFTVCLPLTLNHIDQEENQVKDLDFTEKFMATMEDEESMEPQTQSEGFIGKETILVVEDNPDMQSYLKKHLSNKWKVLQANDGKQGLEIAQQQDPDLIVCDVMMPEMDGVELTRQLKETFNTSHIPIIFLTASSLDEQKIEGISTGAEAYITKPFNMVYLQKRIEGILKQRKQLKERYSRDLKAEPEELTQSPADQEFLAKVVQLVEENMSNPDFSVDSLLEHFSFGRTVFYKKMKGISGYSPKEFVRIVRMKNAGKLLKSKERTVTEVAFEVGFNDSAYFSRLFKKHFGENPSEYQKRYVMQSAPHSN